MNAKRALEIAVSVLDSFKENSSYEDYRREDGWTDEEFETMLDALREMARGRRVFIVMRNETGRRCCLGAYANKVAAENAIGEDREELDGIYDRNDYDIIESKLEDD
jgi:hypothetical protein